MKVVRAILVIVTVLMATIVSTSALAHGPRVRFGVVIGGPLWWGPAYYPPYHYYPPYYPPVAVVPSSPQTYIEQGSDGEAGPPRSSQSSWYYCAEAKAYYPYVKECPGGWQRVAPQPPPG